MNLHPDPHGLPRNFNVPVSVSFFTPPEDMNHTRKLEAAEKELKISCWMRFPQTNKYFQSAMDFLPVDHALLFIALKTTWKVDQCKTAILFLKTITDNFQFRSISWSF